MKENEIEEMKKIASDYMDGLSDYLLTSFEEVSNKLDAINVPLSDNLFQAYVLVLPHFIAKSSMVTLKHLNEKEILEFMEVNHILAKEHLKNYLKKEE